MILQVIAATFAVASFSRLFSEPKDQCILAALNGGIAWLSCPNWEQDPPYLP